MGASNRDRSARRQYDSAGHPAIEAGDGQLAVGRCRRGGRPFQQVVASIQPRQRAGDRIGHQPSLVRKQGHLQAELQRGNPEFLTKRTEVAVGRRSGHARNEPCKEREDRRQQEWSQG